ncbi:MAG: tRNA (guanosine(46)-N7)-methyltransferase TrmB [Verrucomicrobia bacterium]|nr:tRNA (guanosine(46)-N7)-methyltransferase TrmB [Verrucomicrobiota bacterium]
MKKVFSESLRILPDDWLNPLPLAHWFPAGGAGQRPLEVDVGCGKGRFLLARAAAHPDADFLGVDRMIGRLHKIDRKAVRHGLTNIRWLRLDAYYAVTYMIPENSVTTYYIFFPDPWPKKRHREHRLFNAPFLDSLFRTLKAGGQVHFATDHLPYFDDVVAVIKADKRFAKIPPFEPAGEERTDFELLFLGKTPIGRYSFEKQRG